MPAVNPLAHEVVFKVVYYGPGLGGKTTSLQYVHATARPEHRGKLVSLATPVDRTLYFDFLPVRLPGVRGSSVRLQLFTVPGQVYYNATRKLVLTGCDGLVLVFDSQRARGDANLESLENLRENLVAHGRDLADIPHVVQYNKRDLYDVLPHDELERQLNPGGAPSFATVAMTGEGIYESLEAVTRSVLEYFERRLPEAFGASRTDLLVPEGGLAEALRGALPAQGRELRLSQLPEVDPGEAAARAVVGDVDRPPVEPPPGPPGGAPAERAAVEAGAPVSAPSFEPLWPASERALVRELEGALRRGQHEEALGLAEKLVARALAGAAAAFGTHEAPRDPLTVALVLGIDSRRYLEFRALAREARSGRSVTLVEALGAYALAMNVRLARAGMAV